MNSNTLWFQSVDPKNLLSSDFSEIAEIEQDMWAREEGLWEYLFCNACDSVYSKQDIFWWLDKELYKNTVLQLELREDRDIFECKCCSGKLKHSFLIEDCITEMKERYKNKTLLVLMEKNNELIWFMDGYVSDLETIYEREFEYHYDKIWISAIKDMITKTLERPLPQEFFACPWSGTKEKYMNFFHIYNLLQNFFQSFPDDMLEVTGISELHSWWPYTRIFWNLWAESIWARDAFSELIFDTKTYDSDLYVHTNFWKSCKTEFTNKTLRGFISSMR